jgi:hypothetical protein
MHLKSLTAVVVILFYGPAMVQALDRDATVIPDLAVTYRNFDGTGGEGLGLGGELRANRQGSVGVTAGVGAGIWSNDGDQNDNGISIGVNYYANPQTRLRLSAGYEWSAWDVDTAYVYPNAAHEIVNERDVYDVDRDTVSMAFSLKYRFTPATHMFSPFASVGVSWSQADAEADGTISQSHGPDSRVLSAGDAVAFDFDPLFGAGLTLGAEIEICKQATVVFNADCGYSIGGGSVTIADNRHDFDDRRLQWGVGGALRFFIGDGNP